ncbi:MAG: TolC family protein [Pseudomonadota bacterium]
MRYRALLSSLLFLSCSVHGETLDDAVAKAVRSDPRIASAQAQWEGLKARMELAARPDLPQVNFELGRGQNLSDSINTRSVGNQDKFFPRNLSSLTMSMQLFDAGATKARVDAAGGRAQAGEARVTRATQTTIMDVIQAYQDVWRSQQLLLINDENRRVHQELVAVIKGRVDAQQASLARLAEVSLRLREIENERVDLLSQLKQSEEAYRLVTGVLPDSEIEIPVEPEDMLAILPLDDVEAMVRTALDSHPEVKASNLLIQSAGREVNAAKSGVWPSVALEGRQGYDDFNPSSTGGRSTTRDLGVMLRMRWSLYGNAVPAQVKEAEATRVQSTAERDRVSREIERAIRLALYGIASDSERVDYLNESVALAEKAVDARQRGLANLSMTEESVLAASGTFTLRAQARAALVNVGQRKVRSIYSLLEAMGKLPETFGVTKAF